MRNIVRYINVRHFWQEAAYLRIKLSENILNTNFYSQQFLDAHIQDTYTQPMRTITSILHNLILKDPSYFKMAAYGFGQSTF